ncbi:hypothetical protein ABET39_22920, partial [Metabacillus fastidiosus]
MPFSKKEMLRRIGMSLAATTLATGTLIGCSNQTEETKGDKEEKTGAVIIENNNENEIAANNPKTKDLKANSNDNEEVTFSKVDLIEMKNQAVKVASTSGKESIIARVALDQPNNKLYLKDKKAAIAAANHTPTFQVKVDGDTLAFVKPDSTPDSTNDNIAVNPIQDRFKDSVVAIADPDEPIDNKPIYPINVKNDPINKQIARPELKDPIDLEPKPSLEKTKEPVNSKPLPEELKEPVTPKPAPEKSKDELIQKPASENKEPVIPKPAPEKPKDELISKPVSDDKEPVIPKPAPEKPKDELISKPASENKEPVIPKPAPEKPKDELISKPAPEDKDP